MNEKITKKVGEACAFAEVLAATYSAHETVMKELLAKHATTLVKTTSSQITALQSLCDEAGTTNVLVVKVEKTATKITAMGEMYVGDDWDDAAEVLEWMSFFVGGAIVHWQLIAGAGEAMGHTALKRVSDAGVVYYTELMDQLKLAANTIGAERAG